MSVQRGEIYFVNLNPVQGREQAGRRPVLVISADIQSIATRSLEIAADTQEIVGRPGFAF